jgi:hypothetical protein
VAELSEIKGAAREIERKGGFPHRTRGGSPPTPPTASSRGTPPAPSPPATRFPGRSPSENAVGPSHSLHAGEGGYPPPPPPMGGGGSTLPEKLWGGGRYPCPPPPPPGFRAGLRRRTRSVLPILCMPERGGTPHPLPPWVGGVVPFRKNCGVGEGTPDPPAPSRSPQNLL